MAFDPLLADIRFGCGRSPVIAPPSGVEEMLTRLTGPDAAAAQFPVPGYDMLSAKQAEFARQRREIKPVKDKARRDKMQAAYREMYMREIKELRREHRLWLWNQMMRRAHTEDGLRERLVAFWADHFAASGKNAVFNLSVAPSHEDTIRPHLTGRFADLVKAVMTQPLMLHFLDQTTSRGPNSQMAQKKKGGGLNENLARELMELHTLGVDGPYTQADVRELAELLAGLSIGADFSFLFRPALAEPGAETVLGRSYGGPGEARLEDVLQVLDDLATHPVTARHIARKLAVHFVADTPDPALVDHVAARFEETGGQLDAVYGALLEHPAAWDPAPGNVKRPLDFIGSALRLFAVPPDSRAGRQPGIQGDLLRAPLMLMGQPWDEPPGPEGWPEEDEAWVSPQRLAARVRWAWTAPSVLMEDLPDPRALLTLAVGDRVDEALDFAVKAAADRTEGVALVLCSPAFQRM
ncbi:DUF1800 domain-containing protein [Pseudooceanicola nanhaiensis]|uniref:DUF1800 domain-containing protein n=1 Tax=Pseudooceanicola nanhaiensis TaxID=375761 RepID=UPI001CD7BCC1|nr:DUF1800 domain-containing protein [Pseudooceanicola nanhaiensis]MCA0922793.1 DUF1800 domain-containing protein [Pseudooceanicola nanhaiensis]